MLEGPITSEEPRRGCEGRWVGGAAVLSWFSGKVQKEGNICSEDVKGLREKSMWILRMRILGKQQVQMPKAGSCLLCPGNSKAAGVTGPKSAAGRVEGDTVREEMGPDSVTRALRTGEVCRLPVSKKGSLWKVLSRKGTWCGKVTRSAPAETPTLPTHWPAREKQGVIDLTPEGAP